MFLRISRKKSMIYNNKKKLCLIENLDKKLEKKNLYFILNDQIKSKNILKEKNLFLTEKFRDQKINLTQKVPSGSNIGNHMKKPLLMRIGLETTYKNLIAFYKDKLNLNMISTSFFKKKFCFLNKIQKMNFCIYQANKEIAQKKYSFAIIGSGPGGFYSAKQILKKYPKFQIDIYEKLPHPYGLVRTGIAPDHQEAKNVEKDFSELMRKQEHDSTGVRFYGNIQISKDLSFEDLKQNYSGIIFSYGAEEENKLNLLNEDCFGCFSARNFVNWYNGHIYYTEKSDFMSPQFDLSKTKDVVIIGNGNVAMDICRILCKNYNEIKNFDIPEKVLEKLSKNKIKNIHIIARRGLVQSAFTVKELREVSRLNNVNIYVLKSEIENSLNENSQKEMDAIHASERRHYERKLELIKSLNILEKEAQIQEIAKTDNGKKNIFLRFLLTPAKIEVVKEANGINNVSAIKFLRSHLEGKPNNQNAIINKEEEENLNNDISNINKNSQYIFNTNVIFKSIGYKCTNIFPKHLKFDTNNNVILNKWGVVFDRENNLYDDVFTCGWVKRGAKGIVDSTLRDSYDTFNSINYLLEMDKLTPKIPDNKGIIEKLERKNITIFTNEKWNLIDKIELERGSKLKKIREKIINIEEMKRLVS